MKILIRQLSILSFLLIITTDIFSQVSNDFIKIIPGKIYPNDISPSKYKLLVSLSGGTILYTTSVGYSQTKFGQDYQLSGIYFLSDSRAFKIDARFSYISPKYPNVISNPLNSPAYYGGNTSMYTIKANFLTGSFNPGNKLIAYVSAGIGFHYYTQSKFGEIGDSLQYYYGLTFTVPPQNKINVVFSLGASLGYRFSKNFGAAMELEYNYITNYYNYVLYGAKNNFPIRVGIFYAL